MCLMCSSSISATRLCPTSTDIHISESSPLLGRSSLPSIPFLPGLSSAMEKLNRTRVGRIIDKAAVDSEPGLTAGQLMLANHDLKPVEPERYAH